MLDALTLLDRAPSGVRRLANRVAQGQGVLGRLADATRYRFSERDVPDVPPPSDASNRLLIGPANSAGQGYQWARAADRRLKDTSVISMRGINSNVFAPRVDLAVPTAVYQRSATWHERFEDYLSQQSHIMWESGLPLLGRRYGSAAAKELSVFRARGVDAALIFHGSDIRPPAQHAETSPWSPFKSRSGLTQTLEDTASSNAELAARSDAVVFVSTPDQLRWLPTATWLPVVVDMTQWRPVEAGDNRVGPPVVAHAPSQKWLKGTDQIEPMLRRLSAEGVIEYRQIVGIPHASMPAFYGTADIVLDQFVLGIYGVAACEAMAAGRIVMSHVDDFTRAQVRERTGLDLPVHEATLETLEAELRRAASAPESFDMLRSAGPAFVDQVHSGSHSAAAMRTFLGAIE